MKALLLNGSPAKDSHTLALLRHLEKVLADSGVDASVIDLNELGLPYNDPAYHDNPTAHPNPKVGGFASLIESAQVVVLGSPMYHGSFSGLLKSALDNLVDDAFRGKAVGLVSNSSGPRSSVIPAQALVFVARTMQGRVSNRLVGTSKADYSMQDGVLVLTSQEILDRSKLFVKELLELV